MKYGVEDLIREIKVALDENKISDQLLSTEDIDTLALDEIIRSKIEPAARIVESEAPRYLLDSGVAFGGTIGWPGEVGKGHGLIHLPDDFMRLVTFQMSDWERPAIEAIEEGSVEYAKQRSRYAGIRGNPQKPVVAITQQPVGQVLEFYSCIGGENVTLLRARYIPYPKISSAGVIDLCEKLKSAIVHYTAYLTAMTLGETNQAQILLVQSQSLMK